MAGVLKKTTGLVGLAVSHNPHERLRILYSKILASLQVIPQDAAYRKYTEQLVNDRFDLIKAEPDVEKLEKKINCGQIEEVIHQVQRGASHSFHCIFLLKLLSLSTFTPGFYMRPLS
uniref:NADH dehydrogenase [ubiquinone] 1 alpha subcomplex subunit 5 n=1 Tax=Oncorhynchus tshawytscha TaxID=74940 RepID=A0AAZ3QFH1_ONCTS